MAASLALAAFLVQGDAGGLSSVRAEEATPPATPPNRVAAPSSATSATPSARAEASEGKIAKGTNALDLERAEDDLRSIFDPTVIKRKVVIENEFVDLEDTACINETKLGGTFAIGPAEDFDVAFNGLVPNAYHASKEPPGTPAACGSWASCGSPHPPAARSGRVRSFQDWTWNQVKSDAIPGDAIP